MQKKNSGNSEKKLTPDVVNCGEYFDIWFQRLEDNNEVRPRTLRYYKSYLDIYLHPFFGEESFSFINKTSLYDFYKWARERNYKPGKSTNQNKEMKPGRTISNTSLNKCIGTLKTICKSAISEYEWSTFYNPFSDYKKLPEDDPYDKIHPFSLYEYKIVIDAVPVFWKPYFMFSFASGLRQGEQIALKHSDIDWENMVIHIKRARTLDKNGVPFDDVTKNKYSRRKIPIFPILKEILEKQMEINKQFECEYFFCTPKGNTIDTDNLRNYVWNPLFKNIDVEFRPMKQTRHTFATMALSCGENPLWVAKILGHKNCDMIINVYSKYVENMNGSQDSKLINQFLGQSNDK